MPFSIIWWGPFSQEGESLSNSESVWAVFLDSVENKALGNAGELSRNSRYSQMFACAPASDMILLGDNFPHIGLKFTKLTITIFSVE